MTLKCSRILEILEKIAPFSLAEHWDNCGLLVGSPEALVKGILLCLDVSAEVLAEAETQGANMIICHHPPLLKPLQRINTETPAGKIIRHLLKQDLQVVAMHTNYDAAAEGVNQQLALRLGLQQLKVLQPAQEKIYKVVVFVPRRQEAVVRRAMGEAGAGQLGAYAYCSFRTLGTGTFLPLSHANPYLGERGKLEEVEECRIETIVPAGKLSGVIRAMLEVHPYEEVAYDIMPLETKHAYCGLGRIGQLAEPVQLKSLVEHLKKNLAVDYVRVCGDPERLMAKVAVCGGAGKGLLDLAASQGADVLITGDLGYHDGLAAKDLNMALIDAGHFATEIVSLAMLADFLQRELGEIAPDCTIVRAGTEKDPWRII